MKILSAIFLLVLLCGCNKELAFENKTFTQKTTIPCPEQCPQITVTVPLAQDGIAADSINAKLYTTIASIIHFGDKPNPAKTYEALLASFIGSYEKMQREAPDEVFGWEGDVKARVAYQSADILNIEIKHYTFTGGAHGYSGLRSLLFNPDTGHSIETAALFNDVAGFRKLAEKEFRKKFGIPENAAINSKGLMFENERFHLPQNIFFTNEGLLLYYNAYEIASYAEGAKELLLPYSKIETFLKLR